MHWYDCLIQKKAEMEEYLFITQRDVFLRWIEEHGVIFSEQVIVISSDDISIFQHRNRWRKRKEFQGEAPCRFVLCEKNLFFHRKEQLGLVGEWRMIFDHSGYEVMESYSYYENFGLPLPIRLGLTITEKKWLISEIRKMLLSVSVGKIPCFDENQLERWNQQQDMQLTFWLKESNPVIVRVSADNSHEALVIGTKKAIQLAYEAGLSNAWFEDSLIEVTLISDLVFPVLLSDWKRNQVDTTKGYTYELVNQKKHGYFLPEVHNRFTFTHLRDFLYQMTTREAGALFDQSTVVQYGHCLVIDWVESCEKKDILDLFGPVPAHSIQPVSIDHLHAILRNASSWVCEQQQKNGNMPAKFALTGVVCEDTNLALLGCTGHALAVYGMAFDDAQAIDAAEHIGRYLEDCLDQPDFSTRFRRMEVTFFDAYVEVYRLFIVLTLKKPIQKRYFQELVKQLPSFRSDCILWLEVLSLLLEYEQVTGDACYHKFVESEVFDAERIFKIRRERNYISLSTFAELLVVYERLWTLTGAEEWRKKALSLSKWYTAKQKNNGSFPSRLESISAYTRGSAKIVEGLACFPEENKETLRRCLSWLAGMQYSKKNTYFMSEEARQRLIGGFRHDDLNKEVWIDANGHTILALTRYLKNQ